MTELATDEKSDNPNAWSLIPLGHGLRTLLVVFAVPLLIWFAYRAFEHGSAILAVVASVVLLLTLLAQFGPRLLRVVLLIGMTLNVLSFVVNQSYLNESTNGGALEFPAYVLLVCLIIASAVESHAWLKGFGRAEQIKVLGWGLVAVPALMYVVGIPLISSAIESIWPVDSKSNVYDPDWNLMNEASFRGAKFVVFAAFTFVGACVGSFLNVVAHSLPRGESIGMRDSKCPQCETKIQRVDNLPIFSYINLGGRCRNCQNVIPLRYFLVELVAAVIFGSLFLYELVTGCTNVPSFTNYPHKGILWIILYPKWPVIGIYVFHALFFCSVLTLALIELERQTLKIGFVIGLLIAFLVPVVVLPWMQPIATNEHVPLIPLELSSISDRIVRCIVGGVLGAAVAFVAGKLYAGGGGLVFVTAMALSGIALGWQGLMQTLVLFVALSLLLRLTPWFGERLRSCPTMTLMVALKIHHPVWKMISQCW